MEDILVVVDAIIIVSLLSLTIMSLVKDGYKDSINRLFAVFSISMAVWIISNDLSSYEWIPRDIVIYTEYVATASGFATALLLMKFIIGLVGDEKISILAKKISWPLWLICIISSTSLVVGGVMHQGSSYAIEYGPLGWLYILGIFVAMGLMTSGMVYGLRHSSGLRKRQLIATGIGLSVSVPLVIIFYLIIPSITGVAWFNKLSATPMLILVISLYYGVVRYRLFDIRSALVRALAYVLSLITIIAVYYSLATLITGLFLDDSDAVSQNPINIVLAISLLIIFQPIKRFFDKLTNKIFYSDYYNAEDFFSRFNRTLISTTDLHTLLERAATEIATTLKSEQAFFFVHTNGEHHTVVGTANYRHMSKEDIDSFHHIIHGKRTAIMNLSMLNDDDPIYNLMKRNHVAIVMPVIGTRVIGYLAIGNRITSIYTPRDIQVLGALSDGLAIAIQNNLSIKEIKDINTANLKQRISDATKELQAKNEVLRQIDEEKDEFISIASHELRTPMTVIRGYVNLLQNKKIDLDGQKNMLEKVSLNTKALIDMVNNMLDLSKLESGKLEMMLTDVAIDDLINASVEQIRLLYVDKGVDIKYHGSGATIRTDPEKFARIVLNLLNNAYKFTPSGGSVTITSSIDKVSHIVVVCVADTGIGIPSEGINSLFKKFSQVDNYLQRQAGGTGLGLSICKQLVEKLGGRIWVESTPDVGSKFYFTTPMSEKQ